MPSANLDLARSIAANWEHGDYSDTGWAHPDIEFVIADVPDSGASRGVGGMIEAWGEFLSAWDEHRIEVENYRELDPQRILALGRLLARGKTSKLDVQRTRTLGATLFHICDGKVTRLVIYFDRDRAFADLGLTRESEK